MDVDKVFVLEDVPVPALQVYVYGAEFPPEATTAALPLFAPKQVMLWVVKAKVAAGGCVSTTTTEEVHKLASRARMV